MFLYWVLNIIKIDETCFCGNWVVLWLLIWQYVNYSVIVKMNLMIIQICGSSNDIVVRENSAKGSSPNFASNIKQIDFRGHRSKLICLDSLNIRSKIWRRSPSKSCSEAEFIILSNCYFGTIFATKGNGSNDYIWCASFLRHIQYNGNIQNTIYSCFVLVSWLPKMF